jgi:hypothetical protein
MWILDIWTSYYIRPCKVVRARDTIPRLPTRGMTRCCPTSRLYVVSSRNVREPIWLVLMGPVAWVEDYIIHFRGVGDLLSLISIRVTHDPLSSLLALLGITKENT